MLSEKGVHYMQGHVQLTLSIANTIRPTAMLARTGSGLPLGDFNLVHMKVLHVGCQASETLAAAAPDP